MESNISNQMESCCEMKGRGGVCPKPLENASSFLSKKWAISIVATIGNFETLRFTELLHKIKNISPKILTERLRELEQADVVIRKVYKEIPPRTEYALSKDGFSLFKALAPLIQWAENR
jgi:DNA-binding HxlR family transcriptional regulator